MAALSPGPGLEEVAPPPLSTRDGRLEEVAQGIAGRRERQFAPGDLSRGDPLDPVVLVTQAQGSALDARPVDDDHDRRARIGVDADETAERDLEARLLPRLAFGAGRHRLAPVDVSGREGPFA